MDQAERDEPPTNEEVMRVRRYECSLRGHSWSPVEQLGREDPVAIVCSHCGRQCAVVAPDEPRAEESHD